MPDHEKRARQDLRAAIERRDAKVADLAQVISALNAAQTKGHELNRELDRLAREDVRDDATELVDALLSGRGDGGVAALADRGAKAQRIRSELKALANADDRLERLRSERENSVLWATATVHGAALKVLAASGAIEAELAGLEVMQSEVIRRRSSLSVLLRHLQGSGAPADEVFRKAASAFRVGILPAPGAPILPVFAEVIHLEERRWSSALEALARDADAELVVQSSQKTQDGPSRLSAGQVAGPPTVAAHEAPVA